MPSVSAKQQRFMRAVAHDPKFAAKAGVPQSVGQDFTAADQAAEVAGQTNPNKKKPKLSIGRQMYGN
jgi:hypothetical protein